MTDHAVEALFARAEILAEGDLTRERWYGSVMVTFDLDWVRERCHGLDDPDEMDRFVEAVAGSVRVRVRAHRMACAEVYRRYPDRVVDTAQIDSRFSREGPRLLLDIDVEVPVASRLAEEGT